MARKQGDWQQTGFRADKKLLNKFRSLLALEGRDMGPVIEHMIGSYVNRTHVATHFDDDRVPNRVYVDTNALRLSERELETVNEVVEIMRTDGEAAELLKRTAVMLLRMARLEAAERSAMALRSKLTDDEDWKRESEFDEKPR